MNDKKIELIIAYYNEQEFINTFINYANKYNYDIILYNKGHKKPVINKL